jgi:hypothetical protein
MALAASVVVVLHVLGAAVRGSSGHCGFVISAAVREGGRQTTCLTEVRGYPAPRAVIHSSGTMTFTLRGGTIRARVSIVQRFAADGRTARQSVTGRILGGTRAYAGRHGTLTGGGTLVDTATRLDHLRLTFRLALS